MDWSSGFSARYYITIVDRDTWRDVKQLDITGGSIKRSTGDLQQSADINVDDFNESGEPLIRVWLEASQPGDSSRTPLFTGYASSPTRNINGMKISHTLSCYSILQPAADVLLPRGWYAPADVNIVWQIKELLKVVKSPVEILGETSELVLNQAIIAEQNETHLSMVSVLLDSIGWRLRIDGYGKIYLEPYPEEYSIVLDAMDNDIVELTITDNNDWFSCPNVIRVVVDDTVAEFRDEDPDSKFSIQNRGREVWVEETSCYLNDKETLGEYAKRRLKELQQVGRTVSYDRRFVPDLNITDLAYLNYPSHDLVGRFIITSQTITLGAGCKTSEEVMQV